MALEYQNILGKIISFRNRTSSEYSEVEKSKRRHYKIYQETGIPLVATQDIHYLSREDAHYQDIL